MEDIYGRTAKIGDKILSQSTFNSKGLEEVFVADIVTNFGKETLVTVGTLEELQRFLKGENVYTKNTRSQFVVMQSKLGKMSWMKY